MAKLYFRYGAMGSSKTANAIMVQYNYRERNQKVLMVKPQLENRDGARVIRSRGRRKTDYSRRNSIRRGILRGMVCISLCFYYKLPCPACQGTGQGSSNSVRSCGKNGHRKTAARF